MSNREKALEAALLALMDEISVTDDMRPDVFHQVQAALATPVDDSEPEAWQHRRTIRYDSDVIWSSWHDGQIDDATKKDWSSRGIRWEERALFAHPFPSISDEALEDTGLIPVSTSASLNRLIERWSDPSLEYDFPRNVGTWTYGSIAHFLSNLRDRVRKLEAAFKELDHAPQD